MNFALEYAFFLEKKFLNTKFFIVLKVPRINIRWGRMKDYSKHFLAGIRSTLPKKIHCCC